MNLSKNKKKRAESFRRGRSFRSDATVGSAINTIENKYGLPEGSVRITLPNLRKARSDKSIDSLWKDWGYEDW